MMGQNMHLCHLMRTSYPVCDSNRVQRFKFTGVAQLAQTRFSVIKENNLKFPLLTS